MARARAPRVSMIMLTQSNWTAVSGVCPEPRKTPASAVSLSMGFVGKNFFFSEVVVTQEIGELEMKHEPNPSLGVGIKRDMGDDA